MQLPATLIDTSAFPFSAAKLFKKIDLSFLNDTPKSTLEVVSSIGKVPSVSKGTIFAVTKRFVSNPSRQPRPKNPNPNVDLSVSSDAKYASL